MISRSPSVFHTEILGQSFRRSLREVRMMLLERESYVDVLATLLKRVTSGAGRVVLVSGECGIGKTSLIRQFSCIHEKAARFLWGGCEALFTPHPLAPLQDI